MAIKWKEKLEVKEPVNLDNEDIQRTSIILDEMWFRRKPGAWTNISVSMNLKIYSNINNVKSQQCNVNQTMNWCIPSYKSYCWRNTFF